MKKIGFIGIGVMGEKMARNLMKDYQVSIYTRTKSKAIDLINDGAIWYDTVKELASNQDYIITIVGYPKDVEEVYLSDNGIINNAKKGTYLIDMTTSDPNLAKEISNKAKDLGLHFLDAPVSGGDLGALNGTLSIMVGGNKKDFQHCLDVFNLMGKNIKYLGDSGNGQVCKMANQIAIAGTLAATCEAIHYASSNNLDLNVLIDTIGKGAAGSWQLNNLGPKMIFEDYQPGFYLKHFNKDLLLAITDAKRFNLDLPILEKVYQMTKELEDAGYHDKGTQVLYKKYQK